jgi:hypothetical protein
VTKTKFTLLLPLNYNDGKQVSEEVLSAILTELYELVGGYSNVGTAIGAYRMKDGSKKIDHSAIIWVGIEEDQESELRSLVAEIARQLGQETIYLERTGGTIEFIPPLGSGDDP